MWLSHQIIHVPSIVPLKVVNHDEYMIYKNRIEVIISNINHFLRFYDCSFKKLIISTLSAM